MVGKGMVGRGMGWQGRGWQGHGWQGHGWQGHGWQGRGWQGRGWQGRGSAGGLPELDSSGSGNEVVNAEAGKTNPKENVFNPKERPYFSLGPGFQQLLTPSGRQDSAAKKRLHGSGKAAYISAWL
jgi:hypothetical protein